jgi:hypothetical protein
MVGQVSYVKTKNEPTVVRQNNDPRQGATSHKTITSIMQFNTKCCSLLVSYGPTALAVMASVLNTRTLNQKKDLSKFFFMNQLTHK